MKLFCKDFAAPNMGAWGKSVKVRERNVMFLSHDPWLS